MRFLYTVPLLLASALLATDTAAAQGKGGGKDGPKGGGGGNRGGFSVGRPPVYNGIYYGHSNWNYVVPQRSTYVGGYYSIGQTRYYSPAPIVSVLSAPPPVAVVPPPVVEERKPIELAFGGFSRYEDLAGRLTFEINAVCLDMHHNYQGNKNFANVYADAYGILQSAKYLLSKEHKGDKETVRKSVAVLHDLMHRVMDETNGWVRTTRKQVGTDALEEKLAGIEAISHHLAYDVGIKEEERAVGGEAPPPVDPREEAPPPPRKR